MKFIFATLFINVVLQLRTVVSHPKARGEHLEKSKIRLFQFPGAGGSGPLPPVGGGMPPVGGGMPLVGGGMPPVGGGMCPPGTQQGPCPSGLPNIPGAISICCHGLFPGK